MIAIVIPYYKLTFFEKTLESLANQTDKRFTVYIGDDASTENPIHILEKYKGHFICSYHRFENNLGSISLVKQWERCIDLSLDEEWIMILGDDDVLGNNVVAEFYRQYNIFAEKSNVVRFATLSQNYKKSETSKIYIHPIWEDAFQSYFRRFKGITRSSLSEYVFKRAIYRNKKFYNYPLAWHSDDWAWLEFSDNKPIFTMNESIVSIGLSEFSLSGMEHNNELKNQATLEFYKNIIEKTLHSFSKEQSLELLMEYEIMIKKKRKLSVSEWYLLLRQYIINFKIIALIKLIRRIFISILK